MPPATRVLPTVPMPASVPPVLTVVSDDDAIEPLTTNVPLLTLVAPVQVLTAPSVVEPVPVKFSGPTSESTPLKVRGPLLLSMVPPVARTTKF